MAVMLCLFLSFFFFGAIAQAPNCSTYCPIINQLCNGTNAQFYSLTNPNNCMDVCPSYNITGNQTSFDSFDCRNYHLQYVINGTLIGVHCPHAGPTGGNVCSNPCYYYCDLHLKTCTGANQAFPSQTECLAECMAYPNSTWPNPNPANLYTVVAAGDSWDCRAYHVAVAASFVGTNPTLVAQHCGHSNQTGAGTCGDYCQNYCDDMAYYCTGSNAQFKTTSDCMTACYKYPRTYNSTLQAPVTSGNSYECRKYHVMFGALTMDPTTHCPHAGPTGGGTCTSTSAASQNAQIGAVGLILSLLWLCFTQ